MNTSGLKALLLLGAVVPLAAVGNQAVGLAPGQKALDAAEHVLAAVASAPALLAQEATPTSSGGEAAQPARETRRLETALTDLAAADPETLDDLRTAFDEEVDDVQDDLDDLEADLDQRDDELDELGETNRAALQRAENKLRELEERVRALRRQLGDIRTQALRTDDPTAFVAEVRSLGGSITAVKAAERAELVPLIEAAERTERDEDEDEEEEEGDEPSPEPTAEP